MKSFLTEYIDSSYSRWFLQGAIITSFLYNILYTSDQPTLHNIIIVLYADNKVVFTSLHITYLNIPAEFF